MEIINMDHVTNLQLRSIQRMGLIISNSELWVLNLEKPILPTHCSMHCFLVRLQMGDCEIKRLTKLVLFYHLQLSIFVMKRTGLAVSPNCTSNLWIFPTEEICHFWVM